MMLNDDFSNEFGLYEIGNYVLAKQTRHLLEDEFQELEQALYDDISPSLTFFDYELGRCFKSGTSTENYALYMIEKKEGYLKLLNKIRKQEELFDVAMGSLTPRERDVIHVHYFNRQNNLGLSVDFFNNTLAEAQNKLCSFISGERQNQRETAVEERKQKLISKAQQWSAVG
jgi:hypothetical protein